MSNPKKEIYLILQNIRSLFNIGSIFRSADAFQINKIYLCGYSGYPQEKQMAKIAKTALGAEKSVPWEHHWQTASLIKKLKTKKIQIVALELTKKAKPLKMFQPKFPLAIIVGNEVLGITKPILKLADQHFYIPMHGQKESLNVAIAASIAMYDLNLKRK
ncbi:MAG: TrmH family RNA methyltransferase [Candidatus Parcubacteria bacterium]|nr:TrmH family RNA methyltransferase [Candidatus Parcubacteria bacterium]